MSRYKPNSPVNSDKIFFVNLSGLDERLDTHFYSPKYKKLISKFSKIDYTNLGSLVNFSNENWNQNDFFENEFPYIEISAINILTGEIKKINFIPKTKAPSRAKKIVRKDDIIISSTRPHRGAISLIEEEHDFHIASTGFSIIRNLKSNKISIPFLYLVLRQSISLLQMEQRSSGGNYPAITENELKKILIPTPNISKQRDLITLYKKAIKSKQQKEIKAKELLESIDNYLLTELGIQIPIKNESIENRVFYTKISEVANGRFDPKLYDNNTKAIRSAIQNSFFKNKPRLKDLVINSVAGDWGKDPKDKLTKKQEEDYTKCLVIRATEFDNLYNLKLDNSRVKYRLINNDKLKRIDIQPNDLLIEKSGGSPDQPVGRISIIRKKLINKHNLGYSNFIHKIRINTNRIDPEYLFCFLKTVHNIKLTDAMQSQTNGIRNLIMSNYFDQIIPLPNIDKQREIASHINSLRTRAKELEIEAKQVMKTANKEIEKLILEE